MHVHIWPIRTRPVTPANAAMSDHASCTASWVGCGTGWKWSKTQIDSQSRMPSARLASPAITPQCWSGSMPTRS